MTRTPFDGHELITTPAAPTKAGSQLSQELRITKQLIKAIKESGDETTPKGAKASLAESLPPVKLEWLAGPSREGSRAVVGRDSATAFLFLKWGSSGTQNSSIAKGTLLVSTVRGGEGGGLAW
jgi:hypothetical protein